LAHFDLLEETDAGNWDILFLLASLSLIVALAFGCLLVVLLVSSWLRHFKSAYDDLRETSSADR